MAWRFYVYEIKRGDHVIYVGKGCGKRWRESEKTRGGEAELIAYFKHEENALSFEKQRIAERLKEGCRLKNIAYGNRMSWDRMTDTRQMAREVLEDLAYRIEGWMRAGKLPALSSHLNMPCGELVALCQRFGQ